MMISVSDRKTLSAALGDLGLTYWMQVAEDNVCSLAPPEKIFTDVGNAGLLVSLTSRHGGVYKVPMQGKK